MEFILVNRRTAEKEFKKGAEIYIGYEHKHDGAFYSRSQFPNLTFDEFRAKVKQQLPHTRLAYAIGEKIPLY